MTYKSNSDAVDRKKTVGYSGLVLRFSFLLTLLVLFSFIAPLTPLYADNDEISKLLNRLETEQDDIERIKILNSLCWEYRYSNPGKGLEYGEKALALAEDIDYIKAKSTSLNFMGLCHKGLQNYDAALDCYSQALKIAEQLNDTLQIAYSHNNIGDIYRMKSDYEKALAHTLDALKMFEKANNKKGIAYCAVNLGVLYRYLKKYDKALEYLHRALDIRDESDDASAKSRTLFLIAEVHYDRKSYNEALKYYSQMGELKEITGSKIDEAASLGGISRVYYSLGKYEKALDYQLRALELNIETGEKNNIIGSYNTIGRIYTKLKNYDEAETNIRKAIEIAGEIGVKSRELDSYEAMVELFEAKMEFKKALQFYKKYTSLKETLFNETKNLQIEELQTKYESEKKENEIALLKKSGEIQDLEKNLLLITLVLVFIIIIILLIRFRLKLKMNRVLKKQKAELEEAYNNLEIVNEKLLDLERKNTVMAMAVTANHEIKQPLTVLKGNLELLINKLNPELLSDKQKNYIDKIHKAVERIASILDRYQQLDSISIDQYSDKTKMVVFDDDDSPD
jgi:tetratricopeptide (TPR) repeat protein